MLMENPTFYSCNQIQGKPVHNSICLFLFAIKIMYTTEIHFIKTGNIPKIDKSLFKNNTLLLQRLLIDTEYGN